MQYWCSSSYSPTVSSLSCESETGWEELAANLETVVCLPTYEFDGVGVVWLWCHDLEAIVSWPWGYCVMTLGLWCHDLGAVVSWPWGCGVVTLRLWGHNLRSWPWQCLLFYMQSMEVRVSAFARYNATVYVHVWDMHTCNYRQISKSYRQEIV